MAIFRHSFRTLNNLKDPIDLAPDEMTVAQNVDLHNDGATISLRPGRVSSLAGTPHSLWATEDESQAYFCEDSVLKRFWPDGTATTLTTLSTDALVEFEEVNNIIVYTNDTDYGYIQDGSTGSFAAPTTQFKIAPPAGRFLALYNGRLFVLADEGLYYLDPYTADQMDERNCLIPLRGQPKMLKAVDDGLWVSKGDTTVFLRGGNPEEFKYDEIDSAPAIAGTAVRTLGKKIGRDAASHYVLWASEHGLCLGGNGGSFNNLTEEYLAVKPSQQGAGVLREYAGRVHYLAVLQDTGTEHNQFIDPDITVDSQTTGG